MAILSDITTSLNSASNVILVTPQTSIGYQPQISIEDASGSIDAAPALVFNYEGEQTATLESDITDHYVEDNTAIQDQIALRPIVITTHGFIGELNDVVPEVGILKALNIAAQKLTVLGSYTPQLTQTALIAYNEAVFFYATEQAAIKAGISAWGTLNGTPQASGDSIISQNGILVEQNQNKQQTMFQQFYQYWAARTLFSIQTPWAVFKNMAIKSLRAIQDAETRVITDFEVSFKMMRFASSATVDTQDVPILQGRLEAQSAAVVNLGTSTPPLSLTNLSDSLTKIVGL